jgi:hypothetical protein
MVKLYAATIGGDYIMAEIVDFVVESTIDEGIAKFKTAHDRADNIARIKVGIQLINNIVNGSPNSGIVPPILTGRLRGSGSVFLGKKLVNQTPQVRGEGTPNTSYAGKDGEITVGFNTPYAAKWHEKPFNPGPFSIQSGDVGNKFVEKHLRADAKELWKLYGLLLKKETK